jgi:predicted acetyltransferase
MCQIVFVAKLARRAHPTTMYYGVSFRPGNYVLYAAQRNLFHFTHTYILSATSSVTFYSTSDSSTACI